MQWQAEWKDPDKFVKGVGEVRDYLLKEGAIPEVLQGISDALVIRTAYKAMQYDKLVRAKKDNVKQLRTAPPITRPSSSQGTAKADQAKDAMQKLRKSGNQEDAVEALLNRWK